MDEDRLNTRFDMYFEDYCEAGIFDGTIYDRSLSISTSSEPRYDVELFRKDLMDYRNRPMTARRNNIRQLERTGLAHETSLLMMDYTIIAQLNTGRSNC